MSTAEVLVKNLAGVLKNIAELSGKYSAANDIRLVAVSKTFPADYIHVCYEYGQRHFGENYIDELEGKAKELMGKEAVEIRWHYIGRLQSNKIKRLCAIPGLWCVETVENKKHADILQTTLNSMGMSKLNIFIQVNTSGEKNKGGVEPSEIAALINHILGKCSNLNLLGLMTIGSLMESKNAEQNMNFALLSRLRDQMAEQFGRQFELSMGMSTDYTLAIQYGTTNLRIGSTIFGQRKYTANEK